MMKFLVVGAGAIGGLCGAMLARAGQHVTLVDRDAEHVAAIRANGLTITGQEAFTVRVLALLPEECAESADVVLLAVKALHTEPALAPLVNRLVPDGYVLSMQNGLEFEKVAAMVGRERTVAAFLTFGAYYDGPGSVVFSGPGSLRVGELDGQLTPRVLHLAHLLSLVNPAEASANIRGHIWGKLVLLTVYFATATVDADVTEILADPGARSALAAVASEAALTAEHLGIRLEPVDGFDGRAFLSTESAKAVSVEQVWEAQTRYWLRGVSRRTGIWRDLAVRRRKTEAEPILGAVLKAAERVGVSAPALKRLSMIIADLEAGRRQMDWAHLHELSKAACHR